MKKIVRFFPVFLLMVLSSHGQFTAQDTLRGSITPERAWWDLNFYHLDIKVDPETKTISGKNTIRYQVKQKHKVLQVDLQAPMKITKVVQDGKDLKVRSNGNAHFISLQKKQKKGAFNEIVIFYSGKPKEAVNAPWDGGLSWKKDSNGKPFVATSCQGLGASVWWPNKDHMYDEVDSMAISVEVPKDLMGIANGRLRQVQKNSTTTTYHWFVQNPINNYGVNVNIGDYVQFQETYKGEKGILDMDYYVLKYNLEKAKKQFKDAPKMMKAFEHWFGPYPFYEDSFKLVEVPYLGMEHQSSVTYGNQYMNGYLGRDLSGTGWGLKFDFIIIHEAGHEWFANNITYKDIADMWIHESFTAYSESIFLEYHYGKEAGAEYVRGTRSGIRNDKPIIGIYGVNQRGSGDMYYKGANMLHTLRQWVESDDQWRKLLRGLNKQFYHKTVTTEEIEAYIATQTDKELTAFFEQYLRTTKIPLLEYEVEGNTITYRYSNIVPNFDMPIRIFIEGKEKWFFPTSEWATETFPGDTSTLIIDPNFYVKTKKIN
ncbi:M1 family metallopeptidase [Spongiimicrobium salis]|uniref:M1 family metallopeptidase n=1 Tax=Spongiimicrobium salis TaxID=1667022 RepID=UPI00374D0A05